MLSILWLSFSLSGGLAPAEISEEPEQATAGILSLSATIERVGSDSAPKALEVGQTYHLVVRHSVLKDWSASDSGIPKPIFQLSVPAGIRLAGDHLETAKQRSRNEYLRAPFERMLEGEETRVEFSVESAPAQNAAFTFNVLAYLSHGDDHRFFRGRYVLPATLGAPVNVADPRESDWGAEDILNLGDTAENFELSNGGGDTVSLNQYLDESYVLVTTYRAFW